jgi:hypothetical protein
MEEREQGVTRAVLKLIIENKPKAFSLQMVQKEVGNYTHTINNILGKIRRFKNMKGLFFTRTGVGGGQIIEYIGEVKDCNKVIESFLQENNDDVKEYEKKKHAKRGFENLGM